MEVIYDSEQVLSSRELCEISVVGVAWLRPSHRAGGDSRATGSHTLLAGGAHGHILI